jgi:purine nucleosidase
VFQYDYTVPESRKIRYIMHTDCKNESDDQFTVAHILMTPKFDVKAVIGAHFDHNFRGIEAGKTATASYEEAGKIMELMHVRDEYPLLLGSEVPLKDEHTPIDSEGARFIIEEAMKDDPRPLFIGLQGSATDIASAILMKPEICKRMTAIWIGGGMYPKGGWEFNLMQDVAAANVLFKSEMPLWQVPVNVYKKFAVSLAELQYKVKPHGKVGAYLFQQLIDLNNELGQRPDFDVWPHGELWGLGDQGTIAAIMQECEGQNNYKMIPAPTFDYETMEYIHGYRNREIRVYDNMDVRLTMEDFFCKLAINFPNPED